MGSQVRTLQRALPIHYQCVMRIFVVEVITKLAQSHNKSVDVRRCPAPAKSRLPRRICRFSGAKKPDFSTSNRPPTSTKVTDVGSTRFSTSFRHGSTVPGSRKGRGGHPGEGGILNIPLSRLFVGEGSEWDQSPCSAGNTSAAVMYSTKRASIRASSPRNSHSNTWKAFQCSVM